MLRSRHSLLLLFVLALGLIIAVCIRFWFPVSPPSEALPQCYEETVSWLCQRLGLFANQTGQGVQRLPSVYVLSRRPLTWEETQVRRVPGFIENWTEKVLIEHNHFGETETDGWEGMSFRYKEMLFFGDSQLLREIAAELQVDVTDYGFDPVN